MLVFSQWFVDIICIGIILSNAVTYLYNTYIIVGE